MRDVKTGQLRQVFILLSQLSWSEPLQNVPLTSQQRSPRPNCEAGHSARRSGGQPRTSQHRVAGDHGVGERHQEKQVAFDRRGHRAPALLVAVNGLEGYPEELGYLLLRPAQPLAEGPEFRFVHGGVLNRITG